MASDSLERSIRYALERKRAAAGTAFEQAGLAALGTDLALVLTRPEPLNEILRQCADSLFRHLNVHLVQIWILDPRDGLLRVNATAGAIVDLESGESGQSELDPGQYIPAEGRPVLIHNELEDPRIPCQEWARREGIATYLGYPLLFEDRIIGLLSVYSHSSVNQSVVQQLDAIASGMALCVERKQAEMQVQKLLAFPNACPHPVVEFDTDGSLVYANDATQELATALGVEDAYALLPSDAAEIAREVLAHCRKELDRPVLVNGRTVFWSFIPIPDSQAVFGYGVGIAGGAIAPAEPLSGKTAAELDRILASLEKCAAGLAESPRGRKAAAPFELAEFEQTLQELSELRDVLIFAARAATPKKAATRAGSAAKAPAPKKLPAPAGRSRKK
jgi:PAS domain-containing protein